MEMNNMAIGFVASCILDLLPSLKGIRLEWDKKSLQDHVDICYEKALKRWCESNIVRERIANRKFSNQNELGKLYNKEEWNNYKFAVKSFVKAWAVELVIDAECKAYISEYEIPETNGELETLIDFFVKEIPLEAPSSRGRGRCVHENVEGYIRRYCATDHTDSDFLFYALGTKERHILSDYVVGLECHPNARGTGQWHQLKLRVKYKHVVGCLKSEV